MCTHKAYARILASVVLWVSSFASASMFASELPIVTCEANLIAGSTASTNAYLSALYTFEGLLSNRFSKARKVANSRVKAGDKKRLQRLNDELAKIRKIVADATEASSSTHRVVFARHARGRPEIAADLGDVDRSLKDLKLKYNKAGQSLGFQIFNGISAGQARVATLTGTLALHAVILWCIANENTNVAVGVASVAAPLDFGWLAAFVRSHKIQSSRSYATVAIALQDYLSSEIPSKQLVFRTDDLRLPDTFGKILARQEEFTADERAQAFAANSGLFNHLFRGHPGDDDVHELTYHVDQIAFVDPEGEPNWLTLIRAPKSTLPP